MNLALKEKEIGSNVNWIKKHWKALVVEFLVFCSVGVTLFGLGIISIPSLKTASVSDIPSNQEPSTPNVAKDTPCIEGMFKDRLDDWIINYYNKPDKEDFYCPRSSAPFLSPDIWYKSSIPTSFKSLEINYQLKNKNDSIIIPPSFIFSIDKILRFYIPENNYRIAGFEKITKKDTGYSMERDEVQLLDEPIEYGTETELKVRITIVEGNKVTFYFNLKYISASSGRSIEKGFSYEVNLPKPSPESDISKLKIGFGTFKESCVKPISYKFCY